MTTFIIDHKDKVIHKSTFINDMCNHRSIISREDTNDSHIIEQLQSKKYTICKHCSSALGSNLI
ncbi:hypothetical protein BTS2_0737 [Bacillus sp. TS-2]|nr:hypothetical protein BTS2_0737 [Bacillus sp. TS-2]